MAMIDQKMVLEESLSLALASGASGYSDVLDVSGGLMKTGFGQSRENGIGEGGGIWFNSVLNTALTSSGTATVSIDTGDSLSGENIESPATLMTFTVDKDSPEGWVFQQPLPAGRAGRYLQVKATASGGATADGLLDCWLGFGTETRTDLK